MTIQRGEAWSLDVSLAQKFSDIAFSTKPLYPVEEEKIDANPTEETRQGQEIQ